MTRDIKAYISDLVPNSGAIQVINDEFRHVYQGSQLWSFFETVKTNLIFSQELIVEKDSAIIGNHISKRLNGLRLNANDQFLTYL